MAGLGVDGPTSGCWQPGRALPGSNAGQDAVRCGADARRAVSLPVKAAQGRPRGFWHRREGAPGKVELSRAPAGARSFSTGTERLVFTAFCPAFRSPSARACNYTGRSC